MANNMMKTPQESVLHEGQSPKAKTGKRVYDGEPGYHPRTKSPNAVPEVTYDGAKAGGNVSMKTPAENLKKK